MNRSDFIKTLMAVPLAVIFKDEQTVIEDSPQKIYKGEDVRMYRYVESATIYCYPTDRFNVGDTDVRYYEDDETPHKLD